MKDEMEEGQEKRGGAQTGSNAASSSFRTVLDMMLFGTIIATSLLMIFWALNSASAYVYCDLELELNVNEHIFYEGDKLIIGGSAAHGVYLQALLIPLDGQTAGKRVDVSLKGSHFEYLLHQFGSGDKEMDYAVIVNAVKETHDGTCLVGDHEIIQYKGTKE